MNNVYVYAAVSIRAAHSHEEATALHLKLTHQNQGSTETLVLCGPGPHVLMRQPTGPKAARQLQEVLHIAFPLCNIAWIAGQGRAALPVDRPFALIRLAPAEAGYEIRFNPTVGQTIRKRLPELHPRTGPEDLGWREVRDFWYPLREADVFDCTYQLQMRVTATMGINRWKNDAKFFGVKLKPVNIQLQAEVEAQETRKAMMHAATWHKRFIQPATPNQSDDHTTWLQV